MAHSGQNPQGVHHWHGTGSKRLARGHLMLTGAYNAL